VMTLDCGGYPVLYKREDGASLFRYDIARAKAKGALGMGCDSAELAARAKDNPVFLTTLASVVGGDLALAPGGVLIRSADGRVVGAIGISGDTAEIDELCARAGIEAADLRHGVKS
jgi:uncharacterized protein GlcG (DUF336 family)